MVVTRRNTVHALLYLVVSLFAVAVVFYTLGAPFVAALEVIVYAGAIMVLFLFAVMLLNVAPQKPPRMRRLRPRAGSGRALLVAVLLAELVYGIACGTDGPGRRASVGPQQVERRALRPYVLGVELASMLLLAALDRRAPRRPARRPRTRPTRGRRPMRGADRAVRARPPARHRRRGRPRRAEG